MLKVSRLNKWLVAILLDFFIILLLILYFTLNRHIKINGIYIVKPIETNEFSFMDTHGNPFTKKDLKGNWTFIVFGFTKCKMICPTTMMALNKMYEQLKKDLKPSQLPKVVFITIDPENDTIPKLNQYIMGFNTNFIGARADMPKTQALEKQLFVTSSKTNGDIVHSTEILLLNPDAKIQAYFPFPHQPEKLAEDYKIILKASPLTRVQKGA